MSRTLTLIMSCRRLLVLLSAVAAVSSVIPPSSANVKARVDLSAFKFFSKTAHHVVDAEIPKVTIPDFTLDITAGPGTGKVSVRELNITKFNSPKFEFSLGDDGLSWSSMRGAVKIGGLWEANYKFGIPVWESGWVQVLAVDIRVNVSARVLGMYDRPQIEIGRCTADVLYFDFEIGGGVIPWLVNLFRDDISKVIKQAIHNQACDTARSILLVQFNDFLMTLPLHVPIGNNFYVDYAVDRNITYTRQFVEAELLADVVYGTDSCHLQHVEPWDERSLQPKMITVWMSESVPNCLLTSAHEGKLVQFTVTKDVQDIASYLKTNCSFFSICIGRFFPKLKTDYPDQYIDLHFHTYVAPFIQMQDGDVILNVTFAIDFYINPRKEHPKSLARMILESQSTVIPEMVNKRLGGSLNETDVQIWQDFSDIGNMSKTFLTVFDKVFTATARLMIGTLLQKGVPLPIFDNVTLADDSEIHVFEKHVRLNADFEFE